MDLRQLTPDLAVTPQIQPEDLPALAEAGFRVLINNRPDSEVGPGDDDAALRAAAEAAARAALLARAGVTNIDVTVLQNHLCYLRDYDLGDRCDVRDERLRLAFEARIIEVNEVWKDGAHSVSLQFGDKIPTAYVR